MQLALNRRHIGERRFLTQLALSSTFKKCFGRCIHEYWILYKRMVACHYHCPVVLRTSYSTLSIAPKMKVATILFALIAVVIGTPPYQPYNGYPSYSYDEEYYAPAYPAYNYGYHVKDPYTYSDFGHEETRKGDNTKGQYQVLLPDGRRQIVTYYVNGKSGFVADVKYVGEAKYPTNPSPYRQY